MLRVPNDDARALARRLRELRTAQFGRTVPQSRLGAALGCSVPLISAWESMRGSAVPNEERLRAYAAFFSTPRSLSGNGGSRLLPAAELTPAEAAERDRLERELLALRAVAPAPAPRVFDPWRFRAGEPTVWGRNRSRRLRHWRCLHPAETGARLCAGANPGSEYGAACGAKPTRLRRPRRAGSNRAPGARRFRGADE